VPVHGLRYTWDVCCGAWLVIRGEDMVETF
jgi:hypothetical protein